MMVLQVIPDRFTESEKELAQSFRMGNEGLNSYHIRRPTNGISIKDDTFATLRVVAGTSNKPIPLIDAGSKRKISAGSFLDIGGKRYTDIYSNFLLQAVQEDRMEKQQVLETFGEAYIFLFGERARVMSFTGVLLNSEDFNWEAEWWENYDRYLRGTRCVETDARVYLAFDQTLVGGYIISCTASKSAQDRNHLPFQFQMFVTSYSNFSNIGDPNVRPGGTIIGDDAGESSAPFRPNLLLPSEVVTGRINAQSAVEQPSLTEGLLQSGIGPVVRTWNRAQQIANKVIQATSNVINGEIVRVPIGFEGALVFDSDPPVKPELKATAGVIRYTTYDQNTAEYVGASSHYGSAMDPNGSVYRWEFDNLKASNGFREGDLSQDNAMIAEARRQWRDAGFDVPSPQLGPVSSFLVQNGRGLVAVGASLTWRIAKPPAVPPEEDSPMVQPVDEGSNSLAAKSRTGALSDIEG